jgi:hypothetical protein
MIETLIVLAKEPIPGRVKTRLVPPLSIGDAAAIAAAALRDTFRALDGVPARHRLLVLDGTPGPWVPSQWEVLQQARGGLDRRLTAAFLAAGAGPALLVGMDTPQLQPHQLAAFDPAAFDACLGRSTDGGYWAIGLREPALATRVVPGVPMSTDTTGMVQLARLRAAGASVQRLDDLRDVDTVDDALAVAALIPDSDFGRTVRSLTARLVATGAA